MPGASDPPRVQPHLAALPGYEPVTPVDQLAARAGVDPADVLKLDANENPFGTSAAVQRAIAAFDGWSVYPDPLQLDLRAALAGYARVTPERVVGGAGSDELIELTVRALAGPGQRVLSCPPTFGMYRFLCDVAAVPLDEVERRPDFRIDLEAVLAAIRPETALVILASPNNPSGTPLGDDELAALLGSGATIAVDEAYGEYAGASALDRFGDHPRLIVFRTFSKWAGLAGLRAGYGIFHADFAAALLRIKQPYNVNLAADVAMRAAIDATGGVAGAGRPRRRGAGGAGPRHRGAGLADAVSIVGELPALRGRRGGARRGGPACRRRWRRGGSSCATSARHGCATAFASRAPGPTSTTP